MLQLVRLALALVRFWGAAPRADAAPGRAARQRPVTVAGNPAESLPVIRVEQATATWRFIIFLVLFVAALTLNCASSAHSTANRRDYYVQSTCVDSVTCCLQRNPGSPEACGLSASEAAVLMGGAKAAADAAAQEWDDSHNSDLPEWKRRCIRAYGDCQELGWSGSCYDCFRFCEGQQEWPEDKCSPSRKKR